MRQYHGYCRRQTGSIGSDLFEIGCAFGLTILIGWAMVATIGGLS